MFFHGHSGWKANELLDEDTSMATEDLLVDDGRNRQTIEAVGEGLPQLYVVPPFTCGRGGGDDFLVTILRPIKIARAANIVQHSKRNDFYGPCHEAREACD